MQTKRQLMMSLTCTLAMVVNGVGAFAQGTPAQQERVRVVEATGGTVRIETSSVLPTTDGFSYQFMQGGGPRGEGARPQVTYSVEGTEFSFGGKVVKGAPYSADAVTETIQTLSDGNRIVRHTASKIYRDGEGRERREQSLNAIGPWTASGDEPQTISINDPVSGINYTLNPKNLTARKITLAAGGRGGGARGGGAGVAPAPNLEEMKARVENMKAEATASGNASTVVTPSGSRGGGAGAAASGNDVAVYNLGVAAGTVAAAGGRGGGMAPTLATGGGGAFGTTLKFEPKTESLGKQMIGSVEAEGTRTTITIPAGAIGNESPINIVSERWYSAELQVVVMTKNSDPRTGENTYRLTNILRSEPAPSLFQVPGDYKVEETTMRVATPALPVPTIRKQENDK